MRYNFLDHYWPYCKFSCKLLVLYHCTFNSPICFKSQDFFSSSTHGFGVQNLHYTHTFSRCLGKCIFHFRIICTFSQTSWNYFVACTVLWSRGRQLCLQKDCLHALTCLVLCDHPLAKNHFILRKLLLFSYSCLFSKRYYLCVLLMLKQVHCKVLDYQSQHRNDYWFGKNSDISDRLISIHVVPR